MMFCSCLKVKKKKILSDSRSLDTLLFKSIPLYSNILFSLITIDAFFIFRASDLLNLPLFKMLLNGT